MRLAALMLAATVVLGLLLLMLAVGLIGAYGRAAVMSVWARLNFAAATMRMAEVIYLVFLTELILLRKSFRLGIWGSYAIPPRKSS